MTIIKSLFFSTFEKIQNLMKPIGLAAIITILFCCYSHAQSTYLSESALLDHEFVERLEIKSGSFSEQVFTSLKPFSRKKTVRYLEYADTSISGLSITDRNIIERFLANNPEWATYDQAEISEEGSGVFFKYPGDFFRYEEDGFFMSLNPVLNLSCLFENDRGEWSYLNRRGVEVRGLINERLGFYSFIADNQARYPFYVNEKISLQDGAIPGEGWHKPYGDDGYDFFSVKGYISFRLLPNVDLQFGQDKNFIGNGMRSLFLSNYSNNYLFLKLNTQFDRFHYQNIFSELVDYPIQTSGGRRFDRKFSTTHYLTARITDNFRLGVFENVTFGRADSINQRGFEPHYLNPIIFYRAVEHHIGDPDKVAVGLDWQWLIASRLSFYGQVYIDDFNIKDIRKDLDSLLVRTGFRSQRKYSEFASFRNKFGLQSGIKWVDFIGITNLDFQIESNLVRPYTYSHFDTYGSGLRPAASYTHYSQALAHPLGANFSEQAARLAYRYRPDFTFSMQGFNYKQGKDKDEVNYGANILKDYSTRPDDYGMYFLQGDKVDVTLLDFMISWEWKPNMFIDASAMFRNENQQSKDYAISELFFSLTLRWNDFPIKHNF